MPWRTGRKVGRTIYDGDTLIGVMDTPELAARVVHAVNNLPMPPDPGACGRGICAREDGHPGGCAF